MWILLVTLGQRIPSKELILSLGVKAVVLLKIPGLNVATSLNPKP